MLHTIKQDTSQNIPEQLHWVSDTIMPFNLLLLTNMHIEVTMSLKTGKLITTFSKNAMQTTLFHQNIIQSPFYNICHK